MKRFLLRIVVVVLFFGSCEKNEKETPQPEVEINPPFFVNARDIANFQNASDISVSFSTPNNLDFIEVFRMFIVPLNVSFDSLEAIESEYFSEAATSTQALDLRFDPGQKDIEGNLIVEDKEYRIYVMSIGTRESEIGGAMSEPSSTFSLGPNNIVRTLTGSIEGGTGGMDVDKSGNIYMADFGVTTGGQPWGTKVFKITVQGEVSEFGSGMNGASGNDFDEDGNLYQSNIAAGTISKITPDGTSRQFASGFSAPVGIAVDEDGSLYVCNCSANTISKVSNEGVTSTFYNGSSLNCPNGIDIDEEGNVYVASFNSSNLVKITPEGEGSILTKLPGNNNGHLLIRGNFIYVVSRGLHQIHKVTFSGAVSLLAGSGDRGNKDGPLLEATFSLPNDLAFSPDGKFIYINDVDGLNLNPTLIHPSVIRVIELVE